jgi:UDP-N-acetylmuramoyl-L-alanyl-D-glutamate--2,6-diaminopimelate ligase
MTAAVARQIRLSSLLQGVCSVSPTLDREISGIAMDSRKLSAGTLFLAFKGAATDGRRFIADAIGLGVGAVLVEADETWVDAHEEASVPVIPVAELPRKAAMLAARFYGEPSRTLRLVGVTGTNGKTTCSQLIASHLQALGYHCGVIGTLGYGMSGNMLHPFGQGPGTTPDAVRFQEVLAELKEQRADTVVMEVSSHGLDQYRVDVDDVTVGVFTNLSRDHLDYHLTMEAYAAAKRRLFTGRRLKAAVLNLDDASSAGTRALLDSGVSCLTFSLANPAADVHATRITFTGTGLRLQVTTPWGKFGMESPLLGSFNASNLLCTLATVLACEQHSEVFDPVHIAAALSGLKPVPGRMQLVAATPVTVVVDYAHTPDGLEKALQALREHGAGKLTCVVGSGGERDRGKRPQMAAVAERLADSVILTSDNPRSEVPQAIIDDMLAGISRHGSVVVEADRARAIALAIGQAAPGDFVLLAGKGHEDYQEIAGERLPFSDVEHALRALQQRADAGNLPNREVE